MARKSARKSLPLVAEICLYGTSRVGFAFIATIPDGSMIPGGWVLSPGMPAGSTPDAPGGFSGATECVFAAVEALKGHAEPDGLVRIYAPGGDRYADVPLREVPWFGSIQG